MYTSHILPSHAASTYGKIPMRLAAMAPLCSGQRWSKVQQKKCGSQVDPTSGIRSSPETII